MVHHLAGAPLRATVVLLMGWLVGCAGLSPDHSRRDPQEHFSHILLETVPFYPQESYQCGPAALAMVLSWSGSPSQPDELVPEVYTPSRKGSLQSALVGAARRHGRVAYPISNMDAVRAELKAGNPVIVLQNLGLAWYPVWHYAVAVGYDERQREIILHSGTTPYKRVSVGAFENTWARSGRWGLLVLPSTKLPATAKENTYVETIAGLERARRWDAAVTGYRAALSRWPGSLAALMGLGNSFYALNDLAQAETIFREASRLHPASGPAFNNLAQVLAERGRRDEALEAAHQAVSLGGSLSDVYQETLNDIQTGKL